MDAHAAQFLLALLSAPWWAPILAEMLHEIWRIARQAERGGEEHLRRATAERQARGRRRVPGSDLAGRSAERRRAAKARVLRKRPPRARENQRWSFGEASLRSKTAQLARRPGFRPVDTRRSALSDFAEPARFEGGFGTRAM